VRELLIQLEENSKSCGVRAAQPRETSARRLTVNVEFTSTVSEVLGIERELVEPFRPRASGRRRRSRFHFRRVAPPAGPIRRLLVISRFSLRVSRLIVVGKQGL